MATHMDRATVVLDVALRQALEGCSGASSGLIRKRAESALTTALTMCREDKFHMYSLIDKMREL